jgi:hypothetical protein
MCIVFDADRPALWVSLIVNVEDPGVVGVPKMNRSP